MLRPRDGNHNWKDRPSWGRVREGAVRGEGPSQPKAAKDANACVSGVASFA